MEKFEMKVLGELRRFLGMRITRDRGRRTLRIDRSQYVDKILSGYQLPNRTACARRLPWKRRSQLPSEYKLGEMNPADPATSFPNPIL